MGRLQVGGLRVQPGPCSVPVPRALLPPTQLSFKLRAPRPGGLATAALLPQRLAPSGQLLRQGLYIQPEGHLGVTQVAEPLLGGSELHL